MQQFDIYLIELDPNQGSEIKKTRPCVIISPDEMNVLKTVIIAPMTTKGIDFPTRIKVTFEGKTGQIALDQLRAVDKLRLVKKMGSLKKPTINHVYDTLHEMFSRD